MFHSQRLKSIGLDPSTLYPFVTPKPPPLSGENHTIESLFEKKKTKSLWRRILTATRLAPAQETGSATDSAAPMAGKVNENSMQRLTEEEEDLKDALSPKYDQLRIVPLWWILELAPMQFREQRKCNEWVSYFGFVALNFFFFLIELIKHFLDPTLLDLDSFLSRNPMVCGCTVVSRHGWRQIK